MWIKIKLQYYKIVTLNERFEQLKILRIIKNFCTFVEKSALGAF